MEEVLLFKDQLVLVALLLKDLQMYLEEDEVQEAQTEDLFIDNQIWQVEVNQWEEMVEANLWQQVVEDYQKVLSVLSVLEDLWIVKVVNSQEKDQE